MRVLVIDDNAHHAELAARCLIREGWEVEISDNPEPTPSFNEYDFILVDYSMPQRTGLDVLKRIRELEIRTPVILVTGHGNENIASEAIKQGAYDYVVKDTQLLYLDRLPQVLREAKQKHELIETNRFLIQELRKANERLQKMTITDEMTSIYNYRFMQSQLDTECQRAQRYGKALTVCIIDIDHFKEINDHFGHPAGDMVLRELAKIFKEATRSVDFVGRYAGDEFIIIFPDTLISDAVKLCERIRRKVSQHDFLVQDRLLSVSLCIGVADFEKKRRFTPQQLIEAADKCLYLAKKTGRNRVQATLSNGKESKNVRASESSPGPTYGPETEKRP